MSDNDLMKFMTEGEVYKRLDLEDPSKFALKRYRDMVDESAVHVRGVAYTLEMIESKRGTGVTTQWLAHLISKSTDVKVKYITVNSSKHVFNRLLAYLNMLNLSSCKFVFCGEPDRGENADISYR